MKRDGENVRTDIRALNSEIGNPARMGPPPDLLPDAMSEQRCNVGFLVLDEVPFVRAI